MQCSSCGKSLTNDPSSVSFPCPQCAKQQINRCTHCRNLGSIYKCPECGFEGPN